MLLRASVPPHNHCEPRHPDASDEGHEPLLQCHAGKLEQNGVNPAHRSLVGRPILGVGRANRKAEREDLPDLLAQQRRDWDAMGQCQGGWIDGKPPLC